MHIQIGDDDAYKLCLSSGQDAGDLILFIIQRFQSVGDNLLVLQSQGVRIVKIPGDGGFGEICVFCDIVKGYVLFSHIYVIPLIKIVPLHGIACR